MLEVTPTGAEQAEKVEQVVATNLSRNAPSNLNPDPPHGSVRLTPGRQPPDTLSRSGDQTNSDLGAQDPNLVDWLPGDCENPQNWSLTSRWWLTVRSSILTLNVTFASSAPSSATNVVINRFHSSLEAGALITSLFLCGYVIGPIIWAPLSELIGRRPVFIGTVGAFAIAQLGDALDTTNLATVLAFRLISGIFASAPLTNCGGVIADIWDPVHRPQAMTAFVGSNAIGTVLGPIISCFLVDSQNGFRWVFWLLLILNSASWIMVFIALPETYSPVLLAKRAKKLRAKTGNYLLYAAHEHTDFSFKGIIRRTILRPFEMLATEPILLLVTLYLSMVHGLLYGLLEAFPVIWEKIRGFTPVHSSLIFIGVGIGMILGAILNVLLLLPMARLVPKWYGHPPCEMNLHGAMLAGPFLLTGVFWLGWTGAYEAIPWYIPALSTINIGASMTLVFSSFLSYLVDVYLMYAASALAANTILRSIVAAGFPLFSRQMFAGLGVQYAATLLGGLGLIFVPSPFIFYKYGARLRVGSKFAPALDVKLRQRVEAAEAAVVTDHSGSMPSLDPKAEGKPEVNSS